MHLLVVRMPAWCRGEPPWRAIHPPGLVEAGRSRDGRVWWYKMASRSAASTARTMFRQANRGRPMRAALQDLPSVPLRWRM